MLLPSRFSTHWRALLRGLATEQFHRTGARLDLDRLASRWVAAHPGGTLPNLEDTETGQPNFVALLEVPGGQRHQIAQDGLGLLLRQVVTVRQGGGQMLERDSDLTGCGQPSSLAASRSPLVDLRRCKLGIVNR